MRLALWSQGASMKKIAIGRSVAALLAAIVLAIPISERAAAATAGDPVTAARFELTIDGNAIALFSVLEAITTSAEVVTAKGGPPAGSLIKTATVTLRRGLTRGLEMAAWHELVILGDVAAARKNVTLTAYGPTGNAVARYHLTNAWPSKVEVATLTAGASEVLMETVTMTCEFIQRVSV
jgi:phage tail-like protein